MFRERLSLGKSPLWNSANLFLDRLSFFSIGMVLRAFMSALGSTRVEWDEKAFALRFNSSRQWKKDMSVGRVLMLLEPRLRIYSSGSMPKSCRWPGGIWLYERCKVCKLGKQPMVSCS